MSSNFYHTFGMMGGMDLHKYIAAPAIPMMTIHMVGIPFYWASFTLQKKVDSVTTDGFSTFQSGMDFYFIPHIPVPAPPPGPPEPMVLVFVILGAGSKCFMAAHKVHFGGDKAAVCLLEADSINANCSEFFDSLANRVINPSSVKTSPTPGDYLGAVVGLVVDNIINARIGKAIDKAKNEVAELVLKHLWRRVPEIVAWATSDNPVAKALSDIPGTASEVVQQAVDGEL